MRNALRTVALATTAAVVTATGVMADPVCRDRYLQGDWTLTFNGHIADTGIDPVGVDHAFIACDVTMTNTGTLSGICQDMLAVSVGEPLTMPLSGQITLNRRSCEASGNATLNDTVANFEGRVIATNRTAVNLIEGILVITLPEPPLPGVDQYVFQARMLRQPWSGSAFDINN